MKISSAVKITFFTILASCLPTLSPAQTVKAEIKSLDINLQKSPDIEAKGVKEKKWKAKSWLEIELEFQALSQDRNAQFIDDIEVEYLVYFNVKDANGQQSRTLHTKTVTYKNCPVAESAFVVVYVTPGQLETLFGKGKEPRNSDIYVAAIIKKSGATVAGKANQDESKKWWENPNMSRQQGAILPKSETPFQFLWYDRHLQEQVSR